MAKIEKLELHKPGRVSVHTDTQARYFVFEKDGEVILQIDMLGSKGRKFTGSVSQSIQLGKTGRIALATILSDLQS